MDPIIGHPTCDLGLQRRIREVRLEAFARSVERANRRPGRVRRLLRLPDRPGFDLTFDLRERGEDVWGALRF
jgi:hypothetical protein